MVTIGILFALVITVFCLYRNQKRAHSQVMETKKELKRINLQKQQDDLSKDISERMSTTNVMLSETHLSADGDDD